MAPLNEESKCFSENDSSASSKHIDKTEKVKPASYKVRTQPKYIKNYRRAVCDCSWGISASRIQQEKEKIQKV